MKALALILVFSSFSLSVEAQEFKLKPGKTTDKHGLSLKKETTGISFFRSEKNVGLKPKTFQNDWRDSVFMKGREYQWPSAKMPILIPNTTNVARIPNALPHFAIPDVAAIPNPLLINKKHFSNSFPSN